MTQESGRDARVHHSGKFAIPTGTLSSINVIILVAVFTLMFGTNACMHHRMWRGSGRTVKDAILLPVRGVRQHGSQCGPAALATILNAASDPISEKEIAAVVQNKAAKASLTIDLLLFARQRGYSADFERSSMENLMARLENGQPCLLLLELRSAIGGKGKPMWHYVVAYGFSRSKQIVYIHSGVGAKGMSYKTLEKAWKPGDYWLMHLGDPKRNKQLLPITSFK